MSCTNYHQFNPTERELIEAYGFVRSEEPWVLLLELGTGNSLRYNTYVGFSYCTDCSKTPICFQSGEEMLDYLSVMR